MVVPNINFTTGAATLPDTGELSYNGCIFSPLFHTNVSGRCREDDAQRTVKFMEYTIEVDGYATLPIGATTTAPTMDTLKQLLTKQAGPLFYKGRGNDIVVNVQGAGVKDAAWGPIPELLEYQPLGGCKSAKVKWTVKVHVIEPGSNALRGGNVDSDARAGGTGPALAPGEAPAFKLEANANVEGGGNANQFARNVPRLLQFNYESTVTYGEDYFTILSVKGVLEIPLTRDPTQQTRTFQQTADALRGEIERRVMSGIDLERFRMTKRVFNLSRDKRTLNWDFQAEEKPYMDLPVGCTVARGSYSVRPAKAGMGLCTWLCTLRCTYIVRSDKPRRLAWTSFLLLLRLRMNQSFRARRPANPDGENRRPRTLLEEAQAAALRGLGGGANAELNRQNQNRLNEQNREVERSRASWLMDFNIDEGMYLDSKTITFSATWKLVTTLSHLLISSGLWRRAEAHDKTLWATSIKDVSGVQSWLANKAKTDIIVDFGGG